MAAVKLLAALALAPLCLAQTLTIHDLLARVHARRDATDFRASGRLVSVAPNGARNTYQISMKARAFGDVLKIFCEVTDPASARVRLLLESRRTGHSAIRQGHKGDRAPREIPPASWGEGILNTGFSYEDLLETHFLWHNQTLVKETQYGARACYLVRSQPGPADQSTYSSVTSWLDKDVYYPVRAEKTLRSGGVKEFIYYGLRESKGVWSAGQIECKLRGRPESSFLIISRGSEKARVAAADFDPAALTR